LEPSASPTLKEKLKLCENQRFSCHALQALAIARVKQQRFKGKSLQDFAQIQFQLCKFLQLYRIFQLVPEEKSSRGQNLRGN
jgi:hypothetical protein